MRCPECGTCTEVIEKRGAFRDRRCTNTGCRHDFTTRELVVTSPEHSRQCARTRATQIEIRACLSAAGARAVPTSRADP